MAFDPIKLRVLAQQQEDENWRFRNFLKHHCDLDPADLDQQVFELTRQVWAAIDCTTCANCCKQVKPTFSDEEVNRLAQRLGIHRQQFIDSYLQPTDPGDGNPWRTRTTPCPFLKDNRCSVYEDRPNDCRGYPHLYEPDFAMRVISMLERTFTCPIVYEVMERLKQLIGFSGRKRKR